MPLLRKTRREHQTPAQHARRLYIQVTRGRFHCASCNRHFRGHRALNAHHLARHAQRWTSAKSRKAARAMGKDVDLMRRHARGWLEAAGLRDAYGKATAKARSRPQARGKTSLRTLRRQHRHDRHHERAAGHDRKAARARARDFHGPADRRERRAANLRNRWPERPRPPRAAPAARPAPQPSANGSRPAPARPARTR